MSLKVTIITSVFNGVQTLEDCFKSIHSQTYPHIEHIIIDGGSTDGTLNIIEKYRDKITHLISEPDNGIYDALNKGIKIATGDIVGILNADDMYADKLVLDHVATVFEDSSIDACYADLVYVDRLNLNKNVRYWKTSDYKEGLFEKGWVPPHPTFFVRRNVYEKLGVFDLQYRLAADFELMLRFLGKYQIKSTYVPEIFVKMRLGGSTNKSLSNIIKQNIEIYKAGEKNNIYISPFFVFHKIINRFFQFISKPK